MALGDWMDYDAGGSVYGPPVLPEAPSASAAPTSHVVKQYTQEPSLTKIIYDMLKKMDAPQQAQGGSGQVGAVPSGGMPFLPPTGKGGGVDVVKLAMMVMGAAGGGAGAMGGMGGAGGASGAMGGMGGAGGASGMSGMTGGGGGDWMKMAGNMMGGGGGGGGGASNTPSPAAMTGPMQPVQLPYQTMAQTSPPLMFGGRAVLPSTLDEFYRA